MLIYLFPLATTVLDNPLGVFIIDLTVRGIRQLFKTFASNRLRDSHKISAIAKKLDLQNAHNGS